MACRSAHAGGASIPGNFQVDGKYEIQVRPPVTKVICALLAKRPLGFGRSWLLQGSRQKSKRSQL